MNRHQRRSEIANFKRKVSHAGIVTVLVDAGDPLEGHPLLRDARRWWQGNIRQRRPSCCACKTSFAEAAQPGAFLFSTSSEVPLSASVTAFCSRCWRDLPDAEVTRISVKVLRYLLPNAKFDDAS